MAEEKARMTESTDFYREMIDSVNSIIIRWDMDLNFTYLNRYALDFFGLDGEEATGRSIIGTIVPETSTAGRDLTAMCRDIVRHPERYVTNENENMRGNGERVWISWTNRPVVDDRGNVVEILSVGNDITARKRAEDALRESDINLARAQSIAHLGFWLWDVEGDMHQWSDETYRLMGLKPGELAPDYAQFLAFAHPDDREKINNAVSDALRGARHYNVKWRVLARDGAIRHMHSQGEVVCEGGRPVRILGTVLDITEQKRVEEEREITVEFLGLANDSHGTSNLVNAAMAFFREKSGCEAVGIRLREGDDYPYYETRGFPPEFVHTESRLCLHDDAGLPVCDLGGKPALECMCGNVIRGRFDPSEPFFTARGSFWTNSTTKLLAGTTEVHRQARTRNRCNGEGYESVAVIALRLGDECLGTLQLNDRRTGRFTRDSIALWERLADYLAVALARFRSDEALLESEELYRSLFENMVEGYAYCQMLYDDNGNPEDFIYLDVNSAFARLTGLENVTGKRATVAIPDIKEMHPELFEIYGRVASTGKPESFEVKFKPIQAWLSITVYSTERGYFTAIFENITGRKRVEEALRSSETRFRALIQNSSDIIRIISRDGLIEYDSPSSEKILGYPPGTTIGKSPLDFIHPDDRERVRRDLDSVLAEKNPGMPTEFRVRKADDSYLDVESIGINLIGTPGVDGVVITTRPITERKRAEQDLKKAKEQAELYLDLMGHDINNMHQIAMGYLEFAREMADPGGGQKEFIDKPLAVLRRSARLIDNVRKLQRLSDGAVPTGPVDVRETLADALSEYTDLPVKTIGVNYHGNRYCRVVASELLHDVFTNLIDNAIKHSGHDPDIEVSLEKVREKGEDYYRVAVEDNGPGIPDHMKGKIFNRLLRGDSRAKGMGLGLYIVKSLVESYNGRVWVEDRIAGDHAKGARFVVMLPAIK
jgi:PAS domain S-box-containing protein